jgi:hypothetical protein
VIELENNEINNQDVVEPDQIASGTAGTGPENEELTWMRRHTAKSPGQGEHGPWQSGNEMKKNVHIAPKPAEQKTCHRGPATGPAHPGRPVRSRTEKDMLAYDSDIPYSAVEKANRDLICSLIERQDGVTEWILQLINDLQYRVDDLENPSAPDRKTSSGGKEVK